MSRLDRGRSAWLAAALAGLVLCGSAVPPAAAAHVPARAAAAAMPAASGDDARATREDIAAAIATAIVADMSPAQRASAVVMGHIGGTDPETLGSYVEDGGLGGFILMGSNVPRTREQLRGVTDALDGEDGAMPPLVAIDQEGGVVSRLRWDDGPAGAELQGRTPADTRAAFEERGRLLEAAGISVNFGVVADVGTSTSGFIRPRTLGGDAGSAAERVAAAVQGERGHAFSTLKHFPGHGAAPGDSHTLIPQTRMPAAQWRADHAPPFEAGIDAGAELVMTGHLRFTATDDAPASLSPAWYGILRDDLGFEGVAITDDLGMLRSSGEERYADPVRNAVAAVAAGADMVLMVAGSDARTATDMAAGIAAEVDAGRLEEAATRVVALRVQASGLLDDPAFDG
ncbi:glycoside hydrolase family 3 N-terminal domain-containing protein [Microbacterium sp. JZ31]|uniref:glycoside hydrolase family 3 N-terminal domain-containing protein n=1 Tax=Microbacterium sp. JZ31 TaxID=1906274 RepID=UPI001EE4E1E0|nr:glycoside hydrolase family 3 N-terminal domain-containing protein [Microbacterium sp. JZ31]